MCIYLHTVTVQYAICVCFVDDLYLHDIMRMSKKHVGVQSIGVANKNAVFATLVGPTKRLEAQWSKFFEGFDGFVVITSRSDA